MPTPARPQPLVRVFKFMGITLEDPLPGKSLDAVQRFHGTMYAAITNAKRDGPEPRGNQQVYTYRPEAGVNG